MRPLQMVDLKTQYQKIKEEVDKAVIDVFESTAFINGPQVQEFSSSLEKYLQVKHVIPCANGTDALQIAMMALGLQPGDEVITPSFTYIATTEVVALLKLKPVFVEVDLKTFCIDPESIKKAITSRTKAIVPVHLYGHVAQMEEIMKIAADHNLYVIEDVAQAIGAEYTFSNGTTKKAGTIGTIGCTSFFPSKNLGLLKEVMKEVDKKWKIYRCISKTKTGEYEAFLNPTDRNLLHLPSPKAKNALSHLSDIFKDTLLDEYQFAGIFIDKDFEVKQAIGAFKNFISFPEGNFNFNLLKLVPPDLSIALSTGIRKAIKENDKVVQKKVKVESGKKVRSINIVIKPYLNQKTYLQPFLFIILSEVEQELKPVSKSSSSGKKELSGKRLEELEMELRDTKENLQAVIEEVESANEELQSSNEEIISSNEELQSTNEELQSLNEELHTVNAEHQQKIKELIELNDDLNNYFNNSEVGQILIDKNLIVRKYTPFAKKQINLIESDIGRSINDLSRNFTDDKFIQRIRSVMKSGNREELEVVMNEGSSYLMRVAPFYRQDKRIDGVVVNFIDVTQLKTLTSIIEAVLNSSTSGILAKKAIRDNENKIIDFEYISVNRSAEMMLHLPPGELIGKRLRKSFPEMSGTFFSQYVSVVETGKTMQIEFYYEKQERWYDIVCVKMMDGLVTTFTDITERKKAVDLLALGYEELKLTTNKLEKSNLDLLQFASVASHDLKEPLRKIQAFGNILREKAQGKLDQSEYKYIEKMINSSNRMQSLVDDILTLSRLSNTETPFTETDLKEIINRITDDLEITIKEKKAKVKSDKLPIVQAVPGQMHQLFQNLISNGLKFNEHKSPAIDISGKPVPKHLAEEFSIQAKDYHLIEVTDNGIGFEQKYADKIFGIFQRLEGNSYQGSGIGLAICKKIVDNHKGFIKAESVPGDGTKFMILLPKN